MLTSVFILIMVALLLLIHFHWYQLHAAKESIVVYVKRKYKQYR